MSMADQATDTACPACRARQSRQLICRRCGTDLALLVKAKESLELATAGYMAARKQGDERQTARILSYLTWLSPAAAVQLQRERVN